jgi:hypothetical protein
VIAARIIPTTDDTLLSDVAAIARSANERGMFLISNGFKVVVSPVCPPGFFKLAVKVKDARRAELEVESCAA